MEVKLVRWDFQSGKFTINKCKPGKKSDLIDLEVLKLGEKSLEEYEVNLYSPKDSIYAIKTIRGHEITLELIMRHEITCEDMELSTGESLIWNLKIGQ